MRESAASADRHSGGARLERLRGIALALYTGVNQFTAILLVVNLLDGLRASSVCAASGRSDFAPTWDCLCGALFGIPRLGIYATITLAAAAIRTTSVTRQHSVDYITWPLTRLRVIWLVYLGSGHRPRNMR